MRIGDISETLVRIYNNPRTRRRAPYLVGASGIGKSDSVRQAVKLLSTKDKPVVMYDLRLSTSDPTDFGLLMPEGGRLVRQMPDFIAYMEEHPRGILFLDEITSAPPAVQAPAYQVVLDRHANGFKIPDGWMVVAAGNRQSDRGVTFNVAAPLLNRMTEIEVDTVLDDVLEHGAINGLDPRVMAFLKSRADLLHKFEGKDHTGHQFPTPRGWFAVSDKLILELPDAQRVELIKGDVGHEAAVSFEQFLRVWETMPDVDKIFEEPDSVEVPEKLDVRYCVSMGLSARITKDNFDMAWLYLKRMPQEFQVLVVKLAYQRDRDLARSPAFSEWVTNNNTAFSRT